MSPDDVCGVCGDTRENHGDKMHEFNIHGDLVQKKPAELPRQSPPRERGEVPPEVKSAAFACLVEVLSEKGLLDNHDIIRIFSAGH